VDVSAAGATGSPVIQTPAPAPVSPPQGGVSPAATAAIAATPQDSVGTLLQLLSTPQIADLLKSVDAHRSSHAIEGLDSLVHAAGAAVAVNDIPRALTHLSEYIHKNPEHADALLTTPPLIPIQADVKELLRGITQEAKIGAEHLMANANLVVNAAAENQRNLNGPDVLALAERFAETGQLVNYFRAAELSQAMIDLYTARAPGPVTRKHSAIRRHAPELIKRAWKRVPMLVLLLGWFALGITAAAMVLLARLAGVDLATPATVQTAAEFWGMGFLVLVGVQFYLSVRGARFKNL
jgi:hypothetical protein